MASSPIEIRLSGAYRVNSRLDKLVEALSPLITARRARRVHVDTTDLVNVGPTALALIAAVLKDADSRGVIARGSSLTPPKAKPVRHYLQRMDLFKLVVGEEEYKGFPEPFTRRRPVSFRPVSEFTTADHAHEIARDLTDAVVATCDTDQVARAAIRICLEELAENVIHHADAPMGGFAAAQGWKKNSTIEIGIVDLGIGVRASLTKNPQYADIADDVTAIETALRPRVSSTPDRNAGIGLFVTKRLLRGNGGVLVVRSGRGAVYSGVQDARDVRAVAFPGTLVALRARTDRPLNINAVYRELEDAHPAGDEDG